MKRPWKIGWILLAATLLMGLVVLLGSTQKAVAANPTTMSFQGKVVNANGTNVADGTYSFVFKLYSVSSGGSAMWTETQSSVTVASGVFQVSLGSVCPLFVANACNGSTPVDFNANPNLYLGITFNSDPAGEMTPRVQLQSVPYAFNADKVGGLSVSQLVQISPGSQQSGFINVSGTINGATLSGGTVSGGTLTASAVNGLNVSGTAITGTGVLAVTAGGSAQNLTLNGTTTGLVQIGATSTGNIELGGGSGGSGCTLTNSNGNFLCDGTINGTALSGGTISGGTLTSSSVNNLNVSGTAISGTGALSVTAGSTAQNLTLNGSTTGKVQIGATSTGDIEIGGGLASTGCTITNATGDLGCSGDVIGVGGLASGSTSVAGSLVMNDGTVSGNAITINTPTLSSAYNLTLPSSGPAIGQCLQTDSVTASQLMFGDCTAIGQKLMQTFNTYAINQAATATTAMNYLVPTTATAFSIALSGTTEFRAAAAGSFRACSIVNSAAVTAGTVSVRFRKNGANTSTNNYCTLNTTNSRTNSENVASGVETFAAGDTIGVALVSSGLAPATNEHSVTFTIEYGSGGATPTSLQDAYNNGGSVTTQDATDLDFNLSNTATDSNFLIDIATGSTGRFAVQNNGTDVLAVNSSGVSISNITQAAGAALSIAATGGARTADIVSISNAVGQEPTADGVNALQLTWLAKPSTGNMSSAERVNVTNKNTTTAGQVQGFRIVAVGVGGAINSDTVGLYIDPLTGASTGTSGENAIEVGTGWDNVLSYNGGSIINGSGILQSAGLSGTYSNALQFTNTGNTYAGVSASLSGSLTATTSVITPSLTATGALAIASGGTTQNITINGSTTGQVQIGGTSTGDILLGGGSAATGCTVTNSTGAFACTSTINGATLSSTAVNGATVSSTAVNGLTFSGTAVTGSGALAIASGGTTQNITINGSTTGQVQIGGTSTGDILLGGGSAATGCTVTNSTGAFACSSTINGITGFAFNGTAGLTKTCATAGTTSTIQGGIVTANNCTASDIRLKQNIVSLNGGILDAIKNVNTVNYDFSCDVDFFTIYQNTCPTDLQTGVIAQELSQIFPNLVHQYGADEGGYYWVDYNGLSIYTLKAVSEIAKHIDSAGDASFNTVTASDGVVSSKLVSDGALAIISGKDDNITVDSSSVGLAEIHIGAENAKAVNISKPGATTAIKGALVAEGPTDFNGDVSMHFSSPEVGFIIDNDGSAQPIDTAIDIKDSGSGYKKIINSAAFSVAGNGDVVTNGSIVAKGGSIQILSANGQQLISFDQTGSASFAGNLNLVSASLSGGLGLAGDLNVGGLSSFQKLATFFAKTIFKQDVDFQGHLNVSKDSAGYAQFKVGETKVHINFAAPYTKPPVVSVSPTDGQFLAASVTNITASGFDIVLKDPASIDTKLSWSAVGVIDPVIAANPNP